MNTHTHTWFVLIYTEIYMIYIYSLVFLLLKDLQVAPETAKKSSSNVLNEEGFDHHHPAACARQRSEVWTLLASQVPAQVVSTTSSSSWTRKRITCLVPEFPSFQLKVLCPRFLIAHLLRPQAHHPELLLHRVDESDVMLRELFSKSRTSPKSVCKRQ